MIPFLLDLFIFQFSGKREMTMLHILIRIAEIYIIICMAWGFFWAFVAFFVDRLTSDVSSKLILIEAVGTFLNVTGRAMFSLKLLLK